MEKLNFNDCTLYISARSPFARRVKLALLENKITFEQKILNVFEPQPELTSLNPLSRVPVVKLKDGQVLIDSNLILQEFYLSHESSLLPRATSQRVVCSQWMGIASGVCEKMVEYFLENQRPESSRDAETIKEIRQIFERTANTLETILAQRDNIVPGQLTQADLDMGAALAYTSLRYSKDWQVQFPNVFRYFQKLNARPSFQSTLPPE